jgi:predicted  nucleic acid-binding Zn-ribbon protein
MTTSEPINVLYREWERTCERIETLRDSVHTLEQKHKKAKARVDDAKEQAAGKIAELVVIRDAYRAAMEPLVPDEDA